MPPPLPGGSVPRLPWDGVARGHCRASASTRPVRRIARAQRAPRAGTARGARHGSCLQWGQPGPKILASACACVPVCPPPGPPRARSLPAQHCDCSAASRRRPESRGCLCFKRPLWKNNPGGRRRRRRKAEPTAGSRQQQGLPGPATGHPGGPQAVPVGLRHGAARPLGSHRPVTSGVGCRWESKGSNPPPSQARPLTAIGAPRQGPQ